MLNLGFKSISRRKPVLTIHSAIHKAAVSRSASRSALTVRSPIHSLTDFQELYQSKLWNGWEP